LRDKFVLLSIFVRKGYLSDFQNECNEHCSGGGSSSSSSSSSSSNTSSSYLIECCDVWHGMIEHVNYNSIQILINLQLIPNMVFEEKK
jgi:hypothetical protein